MAAASRKVSGITITFMVFFLSLGSADAGKNDAEKKSYYEVLDLPKDADAKAIKSSYRKLAMKWHPDKNPNDRQNAEIKFREIAEAYEVLSDPAKRKKYDAGGDDGGFDFGGFGFGNGFGGGGFGGFGFKDPNDLFKEMFGTSDPFADFDSQFDSVFEEVEVGPKGSGSVDKKQATEEFVEAVSKFYKAVGNEDHASPNKVKEILNMPKWNGREEKLVQKLKDKYPNPEAGRDLTEALKRFKEAMGKGDVGGDFPGGFGGGGRGFGVMGDMFGDFFGGGNGGFSSFSSSSSSSSSGSSMSFSSFSSSSSFGGKTTKTETKIVNGKRVTKTVETDGETTKASIEEEQDGKIKRKKGVKRAAEEIGHQEF
eukprot:TRINITY_DN49545_c0_g1_i1.p1 TRINITY_DN49545_c0_g1~~TRINITY_DN49545_c0_g1_i1.p1  ORF type:complete len:406 (-),score=98.65 TRINITY_DN49545_c0_g1_i1:165-1268(-)